MKSKRNLWIAGVVVVGLLLCGACALVVVLATGMMWVSAPMAGGLGSAVAVVDIKGVIAGEGGPRGMGVAYADNVLQDLDAAVSEPAVGAIVLDINSPGGGVVASDAIYRAVLESPKPVVASMDEMAASGGYYVACAAETIVALPGTLTGSIGVIIQFTNFEELFAKLGVDKQVIKTGRYKDVGSSHRSLTRDEIGLFESIIEESFDDFVDIVVRGRGLEEGRVRELATGQVYTGRQALEVGLVDELGDLDDAIAEAAELAGISGEPNVIHYRQSEPFLSLLGGIGGTANGSLISSLAQALEMSAGAPMPQYLYAGP